MVQSPASVRFTFGGGKCRSRSSVPGGFEAFFIDVAGRNLRIPDDIGALAELGERYGIEFRGPAQWPA